MATMYFLIFNDFDSLSIWVLSRERLFSSFWAVTLFVSVFFFSLLTNLQHWIESDNPKYIKKIETCSMVYIIETSRGSIGPPGIIIICWTGILKRDTGGPEKKWPPPVGGAKGGGGCWGGSPKEAAGLAAPPTLPAICVSRFKVHNYYVC